MPQEVIAPKFHSVDSPVVFAVPTFFADAGDSVAQRFVEFFTAEHRNANTRTAYARAVRQFTAWANGQGFRLKQLTPVHVAAYIEQLGRGKAAPSVKQHLAAIRMLFDYLVRGGACRYNPATSVRGPKHVVKEGKTPVLSTEEARQLFEAIGTQTISDLRDRALIAVMVFSFARIGAVLNMDVEDYHQEGKRWYIALREKGGKAHKVPVHHKSEEYLDAYLAAAGIAGHKGTPLFRTINERRQLTQTRLPRQNALAMIKRRARQAELGERICCHTFRATGITAYLKNGGKLETAQEIACHSSPRTTKLYDRRHGEVTLDEIERIQI
jgi:integrase/recombinase XerD